MSSPPPLPSDLPGSGSRAVEVVASFGDGVVGVRHVTDPRGGVVRATTKALLAGGAALVASSALAFGYATHVADANQTARDAWIARGKPAWSFRPEALPGWLDPLILAGSALGLAALTVGLARRRSEKLPSHVRLGTGAGVDFHVDGLGASFDLVAPAGDGWEIHVAPGMTGAPAGAVPVTDATRLRLQLGRTTFHVASVPAPKRTATGVLALEGQPLAYVGASAVALLALVALLRTVPPESATAQGEDGSVELSLVNGTTESSEDPVVEPETGDAGDASDTGGSSARMALESGTMGRQDASSRNPATRQVMNRGEPQVARSQALQAAKEAGILGSSYVQSGAMFASVAGTGDITSGFGDIDIDGGWDGDGDGAPYGFGHGPNGFGPGGGGNDMNSVWTGDYNTISRGPGSGDGWGPGGGTCKAGRICRGRTPKGPTVKVGEPKGCTGDADCDPSIIKRYIKRHASKIAYCYERQLLATPGLAGTVDTLFTVMPNGTVMQASATGVHAEVASCVQDVIASIKFPKFNSPFQVKYPFHMRPAGT